MPDLRHYTINTGDLVVVPRPLMPDERIEALQPVLDRDGGPIGGTGWRVDIFRARPRQPGAAVYQIGTGTGPAPSTDPLVLCWACWLPDSEAGLRRTMVQMQAVPGWRELPALPLPWLAVLLLPWASTLDATDLQALARLEAEIACTLIESE